LPADGIRTWEEAVALKVAKDPSELVQFEKLAAKYKISKKGSSSTGQKSRSDSRGEGSGMLEDKAVTALSEMIRSLREAPLIPKIPTEIDGTYLFICLQLSFSSFVLSLVMINLFVWFLN
jgi:hypothetical protein